MATRNTTTPRPVPCPTRQVHLDFHTSEHIRDVGKNFTEKAFQKALRLAQLSSITVFAKCHHSWSYYPTKVGKPHPHLATNLLARQIKAAHDIGVRAPIYYTVGWSATDARRNPKWRVQSLDGKTQSTTPASANAKPGDVRPPVSWDFLDPTGPYADLMMRQLREVCETFPVDGLFFDICHGPVSLAPHRVKVMRSMGLDPALPADLAEFKTRVWTGFMADMNTLVRSIQPDATIFYNGVASVAQDQRYHDQQTHFELEDLPTTWGGYDKFPPRARFFSRLGKPMLAMSGKFHTMWGEFGGFKNPEAIRFEAASMIAYGASCSFGDQLHPVGEPDEQTYRNIGHAYRYVRRIERYSTDAKPHSNLGLVFTNAGPDSSDDQGVANMLMEAQLDFVVAGPQDDWTGLDTLVLTGSRCLSAALADRITAFVKQGGSLLVLADSALDATGKRFALDVGADYLGPAKFHFDYLLPSASMKKVCASPFLCDVPAVRARRTKGVELASVREPYFNRTYAAYCSHMNTPYQLDAAEHTGGVKNGRVVYLPHPLGRLYYQMGAKLHRDYFLAALRSVYKRPSIQVQMPSAARVSLMHQPRHKRYALHLMYGSPMQRGKALVIEDLVPLFDVAVEARLPQTIRKVSLPLSGTTLKPIRKGGSLRFTVPRVEAHEVVTLEY